MTTRQFMIALLLIIAGGASKAVSQEPAVDEPGAIRGVAYAFGRSTLPPQVSKVTDDRGEFRLFWVPPGEYYLAVTPAPVTNAPGMPPVASPLKTYYPGVTDIEFARTVTIAGGEDMRGTDIALRSTRSFKVSGQVNNLIPPPPTQLGAPGVNAAVLFMLNRDQAEPDDANGRQVGVVPLLPSTGQFEISNVPPGVYELLARVADPAAQVAGGLPLAWGRVKFEVHDMDVTNLSIVVSASSDVTGTLVAAEGAKVPPSLRVQLLPDDASIRIPAFQLVFARSAMVGPDGTFKIPAVPEGRYRVMTVAGLTPDLYLADVRHKAVSVFNAGFDLRPGEVIKRTSDRLSWTGGVDAAWKDSAKHPIGRRRGGGSSSRIFPEQPPRRFAPPLLARRGDEYKGRFLGTAS